MKLYGQTFAELSRVINHPVVVYGTLQWSFFLVVKVKYEPHAGYIVILSE